MELEMKLLPAALPESCLCSAVLTSIMGHPQQWRCSTKEEDLTGGDGKAGAR